MTGGGPGDTPSGTLIVGGSAGAPGTGAGTGVGIGRIVEGRPERGRSGAELIALFSSCVAFRISFVMRAASRAVPTTFGVININSSVRSTARSLKPNMKPMSGMFLKNGMPRSLRVTLSWMSPPSTSV